MYRLSEHVLRSWYLTLGLTKQTPSFYKERFLEELQEVQAARAFRERLSETCDVFFCLVRARYDGAPIGELPHFLPPYNAAAYAYMLCKFTSRWLFYRTLAAMCSAPDYAAVTGVVNPTRDEKLEVVAGRHRIDPVQFTRIGRRLRRVWVFLE